MIDDTVANLVRCERCAHGAPLHAGDGCTIFRCSCSATKEDVIEDGLEGARLEIRTQWLPQAPRA